MYSFVTLITYTSYAMPQGHTQYLFFKKLYKNLESLFPAYCHITHITTASIKPIYSNRLPLNYSSSPESVALCARPAKLERLG